MKRKTLILVRHAKTEKNNNFLSNDFKRNLLKKGIKDSQQIGNWIATIGLNIDLILASTANRTMQTAEILFKNLKNKPKFELQNQLYQADLFDFRNIIEKLNDRWNTVLIVAHNPGITDISNYYSSSSEVLYMPTCSVVVLHFEFSEHWQELSQSMGKVVHFKIPS